MFDASERDKQYFEMLSRILDIPSHKLKFLSENIRTFTMRRHMNRHIAYYEIFKQVIDLPGSIAEFGVFWGNSLFGWLDLLETFVPLDRGRKVYGFDHFKGYSTGLSNLDIDGVQKIHAIRGQFTLDQATVELLVGAKNSDNLIPDDQRCIVYSGEISETFNDFKVENPGVRFALINLDVNLEKPTKFILDNAWDLLVPNGIMIFNGYGSAPWEGESKAVDKFMAKNKINQLYTVPFNNVPGAYIKKLT